MLSPCTNMKRTASQAFEDPARPILKPVLELTLHIALSPIRFQALLDQRPILPDPCSCGFGLRMDPIKALERAHYFMNWSAPYASPAPQMEIKKFMLCKIHFSPVGVLPLQQAGLLEPGDGRDADRKGYFRYKGPLFHTHSSESITELRWNITVLPTNDLSSAKSFCFFWYCGGVKALASQIVNQLEAVFCAKYILAPKSMYPPLGNSELDWTVGFCLSSLFHVG